MTKQRLLLFFVISISLGCGQLQPGKASHILLPKKEEGDTITDKIPIANRLNILIYNKEGIYIYDGADLAKGKRFTYKKIRSFLISKRMANVNLFVIIKASGSSTYKNTVNMLDEMTKAGIKKYWLTDISKEEEDYLNRWNIQRLPAEINTI